MLRHDKAGGSGVASVVARGFVMLACTLSAAAGAHSQTAPAETPACTLEGGETRSVIRIIDAETVLLDDNSAVRLIGALAPRSPDLRPDAQPWRAEERARTALSA